ncbi:MAG: tetratricopeptide repeat protein [Anaerolineales bacterium]|nr:tetratricopeptide repeat protein [Anaerolineales bacterium]
MAREGNTLASLVSQSRHMECLGDYPEALRNAQEAYERARQTGDSEMMAQALTCMGMVEYRLGHYDRVHQRARKALELTGEVTHARADALILLAAYAMEQDSLDEMEACCLQAAEIARKLGYETTRYRALHNLSQVYGLRGQFDLQMAADEEAYRIACELRLLQRSTPLVAMSYALVRLGDLIGAKQAVQRLDQEPIELFQNQGYAAMIHAMLAQLEGDLDSVLPYYAQARQVAEKIGDPALQIFIRMGLSRYYRIREEYPQAYQWAEDAVTWAKRHLNRRMWGRTLAERAYSAWLNGDTVQAEQDFRAAIVELGERQQFFDQAYARFLYAAFLYKRQDPIALEVWKEAAYQIVRCGYIHILEQERTLAYPLIAATLNSPDPELVQLSGRCLQQLQAIPPPPLIIHTLGSFHVQQGKRSIDSRTLKRRRAGELLRLLLISPHQRLLTEQVIEAMYPEKPLPTAMDLFYKATSVLRRVLEPELPDYFPSRYLEVEEGEIALCLPPGSWIDFQAFERAIQEEEWETAVRLYQGELYPQDLYAEWATLPRERLRSYYLRALQILAHRSFQQRRARETIDYCHRILEIDPWQEEAVYLGMKAYLMFNDRSGAVRLYRELEHSLQSELGVQPQSELRSLYKSLLNSSAEKNSC